MNSEYPCFQVDWTLVVDYGVMDDGDVPDMDGDAPEGPEYAYCDAIRPDNLELRVHIEGDDPEWLQLGEVPVYLAHANEGCSAKGRALFDRLYSKFAAPSNLTETMPSDHAPWRPETDVEENEVEDDDIDAPTASSSSSSSPPTFSANTALPMPKELESAGAPVQVVDAPGTLVFKAMSLIKGDGLSTSGAGGSVVPRPRDSSQSYHIQSMLQGGSDGSSAVATAENVSWKLVTSRRLHWSARQRTLPLLTLVVRDKDTNKVCGKANVQLAPLVLHPGQALDAWFPVLNAGEEEVSTMSVRLVAQFVPDPVPQARAQKSASRTRQPTAPVSDAQKKKSNTSTLPSWGAGKNTSSRDKLKARTAQVVLKRDPGLNGTRATKREFDPDQLQLIAELGQQLRGAKMHVQIIGTRKCSNKKNEISITCCDLSSEMGWKNVVTSTKAMPPNSSEYNSSFLIPMMNSTSSATMTSPMLGFTLDGPSGRRGIDRLGKLVLPLFPFVLGDGHISDTWYPVYSESEEGGTTKVAELRVVVQIHSLSAPTKKKKGTESSSSIAEMKEDDTNNGMKVVTDRTLILNIKKAITVYVGKSLMTHVIAPRVTVTMETPDGVMVSKASTSFLDYVAPAASTNSNKKSGDTNVQEMDSRVAEGSLDAVWREQLYLDLPSLSGGQLAPHSVLRFEISDANSAPPHGPSTGRIPPVVFASGFLEIDEETSLALSRPMSSGGEKWVSLSGKSSGSGSGNLLIDLRRGPLPPTSPGPMSRRKGRSEFAEIGFNDSDEASMPSTPRSMGAGGSNARSSFAAPDINLGLAGVLHLNVADMSGIGVMSTKKVQSSAFLRVRAVPIKNTTATGIAVTSGGILTYGLETCTCSASTTATTANQTGSMIWDEPLTLSIPTMKKKREEDDAVGGSSSSSNDWQDEWNLVLSAYMASGSGTYDLVGEYIATVAEVLSRERWGTDGNIHVEPWIVAPLGKRTTSSSPTLRFQASMTRLVGSEEEAEGPSSAAPSSAGDDNNSNNGSSDAEELLRLNAVAQIKKTFYSLDLDRSGTVTMEELVESLMKNPTTAQYLTSNDLNLTLGGDPAVNRKRLRRLFARMDVDGNGIVEWDEYRTYVTSLQRLAASGVVQFATDDVGLDDFDDFDASNGGGGGDMAAPPENGPDALNSSNMPGWAKTAANINNDRAPDTRLPLDNLKNIKTRKKKKRQKKKKKKKNKLNDKPTGPPQHQLIFEDSFRWNRKNFDLPKKKTAKEKEIERLEKEEKRKKQTAVDPSDKAEALELQVQSLRAAVEDQKLAERKKTAGQMRAIAMMTKRAREAETLLKSATSGQNNITATSSARRSYGDDDDEGGGSAEYLDLKYRFKQLEKEHKKVQKALREAESRELDLLDERAAERSEGGDESIVLSRNGGSAPNTSRSMRGRAVVRLEELNAEKERLRSELESKIDAMATMERTHESTLSAKESDANLMSRKIDSIQDELDVERERTKTLRKEIKDVVKRLARYERQAQTQSMEQDLATSALEIENARQEDILKERDAVKVEQSKAAVALQAKMRGAKQRQKHRKVLKKRGSSATMLQSQWRLRKSKKKVDQMKAAGHVIATRLAAVHYGKTVRKDLEEQQVAAVKLQALVKGRKERKEVANIKKEKTEAVVKLQAVAKGRKERKTVAAIKKEKTEAVVKLQAVAKGRKERKQVEIIRKEVS